MAKKLMEKYQDLPMDFSDATLVSLAHDLPIDHIVTFDRKDFGIYRLQKNDLSLSSPKEFSLFQDDFFDIIYVLKELY